MTLSMMLFAWLGRMDRKGTFTDLEQMEKFVYCYLLLFFFFSFFYRYDKDITVLSSSPTRVSKLHIDFTNLLMRLAMSI